MTREPPLTCKDLAEEAERLLDAKEAGAARMLYNRLAEACLQSQHVCVRHDLCKAAIHQLGHRLNDEDG